MQPATLAAIRDGKAPKGDVLAAARIAGIMAAKRTPELIPLCHTLLLNRVAVDFEIDEAASCVHISSSVRCEGKTGVEMEALTAVCVAALTIYDMAKALEKTMVISDIALVEKRGGKSGDWQRAPVNPPGYGRLTMEISVRLFATLRQEAGWSEKVVEAPDGTTLGELLETLASPESNLKLTGRPVYAAINQEYATTEKALHDGDVVALFPPVSGG